MPLSGIFFVSLHHQSNRKIMFRKTDPNPQLDIFTAPSMQLGSRASKKYSDFDAWHNQFYSLMTTKIDEEIFKPLFPEGKKSGRPNASIRILVAMSVLKEGIGCSDEDLFEKCEFDLLIRKALGMELLTDVTPSIDLYYLFRRRICEYQERTGIDLMQLCFEQLAGKHVHLLKISGKCVRMDSKLIGSNIACQSRYELIHTTLVKFLKTGKMQGGCRWERYHMTRMVLPSGRLLLATTMRPSKLSQSRAPESDGESHGTTKPVGVTLKTKTLKPIS